MIYCTRVVRFIVDYASSWTSSDPQLDCVSIKVGTGKLQSKDCNTELPFACMQLPGSAGLVNVSSGSRENANSLLCEAFAKYKRLIFTATWNI